MTGLARRIGRQLGFLAMLVVVSAGMAGQVHAAERDYLDLSGVANTSLENDGDRGWSGEGANDFFIYPPVPRGEVQRNGHWFRLPESGDAQSVLMLKGRRLANHPQEVSVKADGARGEFIYFLHNSVRGVEGQEREYKVATYVVRYADGTAEEIPMHDGVEIRPWWTRDWHGNSGAKAWPIVVGQNAETRKWRHYAAMWSTQWKNPKPSEPIESITFRSEGLASPVVIAVTITDEDFMASPELRAEYKRPDEAPADYFREKMAGQQEQLFEEMRKRGMAQGVRQVELIGRDLIAVTIDAVIARGAGMADENAKAIQKPEAFEVVTEGGEPITPAKVGRKSFEYWNGDVGRFVQNTYYWHTYYLQLPQALESGKTYRVTVKELPAEFKREIELAYDEAKTITPAIKVNQVGYSSLAQRRYAYLGWWSADLGAVDYGTLTRFSVVDEASGAVAHEGEIRVREASDELSGEKVHEMDLSALKPGRYHVRVPGLGRSDAFAVGGDAMRELYIHTNRAFYHQRCGHELGKPYTDFEKPECHLEVWESGFLAARRPGKPGEEKRTFRGGYHDAADFDVFTYHLRATAQVLAMYEAMPAKFADRDLNIPESGNGVPDVLDEANWALFGHLAVQLPDGGVPYGRGNDEDAIRDWERAHNGTRPPFALFPPEPAYNMEYAAVAAQYARLIEKYDAAKAKAYRESAKKAFEWGMANIARASADRGGKLFAIWAAAELFSTTGEAAYHDAFKKLYAEGATREVSWRLNQFVPICLWPYIVTQQPGADEKIQGELRAQLVRMADDVVRATEAPAYRVGRGKAPTGNGWGNLNGGGRWADPCIRAYLLTQERKYFDAACLNADFQLGANPLSKTFITGMGARPPRHPQISAFLYTGEGKTGDTVKGITIYGLTGDQPKWYPEMPPWRRWRDLGNGSAEISSEFTITETIGASAMLYSFLYAVEP